MGKDMCSHVLGPEDTRDITEWQFRKYRVKCRVNWVV